MATTYDAVVIGAGIAGLAVAAELARDRRVMLLESEATYASHATGRSAASWIPGYGRPAVTPFTLASRAWFESGGGGRAEGSLLHRRGLLLVDSGSGRLRAREAAEGGGRTLEPLAARALFPVLRPEAIRRAVHEPDTFDIDVMGAVEAFRAVLRSRGAMMRTTSRVTSITQAGFTWRLESAGGSLEAALLVNAAGAWADQVASLAGLPPLGLAAYRRTVCTFAAPEGMDASTWPLLMDDRERFYLKPEAGGFLASPADEAPQAPADARPRMDDVALALDRVSEVTTLVPRSVRTAWAGLRTFAPDRSPVLGPDPLAPAFAWFAGLGGFGIMVAPAAARAVLSLIDAGRLPQDVVTLGADRAAVLPDRLRGCVVGRRPDR